MKEKQKKTNNNSWVIFIAITTFVLSLLFSFISNTVIANLNIILGIVVLILVILIGVMFDLIAVAVTVGNEEDFHAQASKKIKGAKTSIKMIRNSAKVSNFCADVIGDICGVLSGAIAAMLAVRIATVLHINVNMNFLLGAVVAAVTVCSKAAGKVIGQEHSTEIVHIVGKLLNRFMK